MANPNLYYDVIKRPLVTEKSTVLQDIRNQYTFEVADGATKNEIRKAVETLFDVAVEHVNVMNVPGKLKRILGRPGRTRQWRKAIVTLRQGDSIEIV
ncbi:MAG: 50S ribosomal protein L23 [Planctomycetes bacterium]|nr:50S ribosomal protein L23 [Planctomycetota bacterium]